MTLLDECIESLGDAATILPEEIRKQILFEFEESFAFTAWGQIQWDAVSSKAEVNSIKEIDLFLEEKKPEYNNTIYVIWDEGSLPIIQSTLTKVVEEIDEITAVSFDTWIFSPQAGYVIEIYHDGEVRIGIR